MAVTTDQLRKMAPTGPAGNYPACADARMVGWPDAGSGSKSYWPAPRAAYGFTALVAADDTAGIGSMWTSLDLTEQVDIIAALGWHVNCSAYEAERDGHFPVKDLTSIEHEVCPGALRGAMAALGDAEAWMIPACSRCLRTVAEALAELVVKNQQMIMGVSRPVVAHVLAQMAASEPHRHLERASADQPWTLVVHRPDST